MVSKRGVLLFVRANMSHIHEGHSLSDDVQADLFTAPRTVRTHNAHFLLHP